MARKILLTAAIISLCVPWLHGGEAEENVPAEPMVFHVKSIDVLVPTLVTNKSGEIVHGLKPENFIVRVDGKEQPFNLNESPDSEKISIIVAVQVGGSAYLLFENRRKEAWDSGCILDGLGTMVENFVGAMDAEIAVVAFDSRVSLVQDFTGNLSIVKEKLNTLEGSGDSGAAVLDAVDYAFRLFGESKPERRHILFLISETRDHKSKTVKAEALDEKLAAGNIQIHSIAFKPLQLEVLRDLKSNKPAQRDNISQLEMIIIGVTIGVNALAKNAPRPLAENMGGEQILFFGKNSFDSTFANLANQFRNTYLISFQAPDTDPGFHKIQIRLRNAPKDAIVRSRSGYMADSKKE